MRMAAYCFVMGIHANSFMNVCNRSQTGNIYVKAYSTASTKKQDTHSHTDMDAQYLSA
jgi:hypothetical protein